MKRKKENKKSVYFNFGLEQEIIHHLMLKSPFISNIGLLHGKMGISLFFFFYSRIKNKEVYYDFAEELLEEVWESVEWNTPNDFSSGLTGIGWGIEYLLQNGYLSGDGNEICMDIDNNIMKENPEKICSDFSGDDLNGFLHYILIRLSGTLKRQTEFAFDRIYRKDLYRAFTDIRKQKEVSTVNNKLINDYCEFIQKGKLNYTPEILFFIETTNIHEKNVFYHPFGLKKGLAGYLYAQIMNQKA